MIRTSALWKKRARKISKTLIGVGALAGAVLAIAGLWKVFFPGDPEEYDDKWIPLVYSDAGDFRSFLDRNDGKTVTIRSAIALDMVLPVNHLVHQVCEMELPDQTEKEEAKSYYSIGFPEFSEDFDESELDSAIYSESSSDLEFPASVLEKVKCMDTLRIEMINPKGFRWSYGGTGTQSLPISGTFKITSRVYSGPRIEYTLRQVAE
jgi:hypothetical protein